GQESQLTGALYRDRQLSLVTAARTRDASRADLALLAHRPAQRAEVLVVDDVDLVAAERARLEPAACSGTLTTVTPAARLLPATLLCHAGSSPAVSLERNVVVRGSTAHGRRLVEVGRVGGNVALRREPRAVPSVFPRTEELHGVGNNIDGLPLVAFLVLPLTPLEAPVDGNRAALRQVGGAVLALRSP